MVRWILWLTQLGSLDVHEYYFTAQSTVYIHFRSFLCTLHLLERGHLVPGWPVIISFSFFSSAFVAERAPISLAEMTPSIHTHLVIFCRATFHAYRAGGTKERWMCQMQEWFLDYKGGKHSFLKTKGSATALHLVTYFPPTHILGSQAGPSTSLLKFLSQFPPNEVEPGTSFSSLKLKQGTSPTLPGSFDPGFLENKISFSCLKKSLSGQCKWIGRERKGKGTRGLTTILGILRRQTGWCLQTPESYCLIHEMIWLKWKRRTKRPGVYSEAKELAWNAVCTVRSYEIWVH